MPVSQNPFLAQRPNQSIFGSLGTPNTMGPASAIPVARPAPVAAQVFAPPPAPAQPAPPGSNVIEQRVLGAIPGAVVTSGMRSVDKNRQVGGAANSYHLESRGGIARDFVPPAGMSMNEFHRYAAAAVGPGWDVINEGDHIHIEPGNKYVEQAQAALSGAPLINPFDPSYFNQALGQIGAAQQQALQPFEMTVPQTPAPEMPEAPTLATRDFSGTDAQLATLAPTPFGEEESSALRRRNLWMGAAQALAGLDEDAGVGKVLASIGAGMLGGRLSADAEIQARADDYDQKMLEYNQMKFRYDDAKAQTKLDEANNQVMLAHEYAIKKWDVAMQQWSKNNTFDIQGGNAVVSSTNADGSISKKVVPLPSVIMPQFNMAKAEVFQSMGNQQNNANAANASLINSEIVRAATMDAMEMGMDPADGMLTSTAILANQAVAANMAADIVGADVWAEMLKYANDAVTQAQPPGAAQLDPKGTAEAVQKALTGQLMIILMQDETARANLQDRSAILTGLRTVDQEISSRTKIGNTTTTVKN